VKNSDKKVANILKTTCMLPELPKIIGYVRKFDDKCIITANALKDIDGPMLSENNFKN
jgi:uncharacterized membrane-anchored protein YitT (DUF2179 family)